MSESSPEIPSQRIAVALGSLWWLPLLRGVMLLILGFYALLLPGITISILAQVVGIFIVIDGIFSIIAGIIGAVPSRGWVIIRGVLEILVGAFVFANPVLVAGITAAALVYFLAFVAIVAGVLEIVAAIQDRKSIEGEGWLMLGGAVMVLFGVLLAMTPLASGLALVRVLGIFAILAGVSLIAFAFRIRRLGTHLRSALAS